MPKIILDDVTNLNNQSSAQITINSNSDKIEAAIENTLSRNGTSPNTMNAVLDMNGFRILNSPSPTQPTHLVRKMDLDAVIPSITEAANAAIATVEESTEAAVSSAADAAASAISANNSAEAAEEAKDVALDAVGNMNEAATNLTGGTGGQVLRKQSNTAYDFDWATITGTGDMASSVYDPTGKGANAFSQDNMSDGTTNKNYTATEKTKLAGIAAGAQVNTVASVAGKTGAVTLTKADVGLGNVENVTSAYLLDLANSTGSLLPERLMDPEDEVYYFTDYDDSLQFAIGTTPNSTSALHALGGADAGHPALVVMGDADDIGIDIVTKGVGGFRWGTGRGWVVRIGNTLAQGDHAAAFGDDTIAQGNHSFAGGFDTDALGDRAFAFGTTSYAAGYQSVAMGDNCSATGIFSHVGGQFADDFGRTGRVWSNGKFGTGGAAGDSQIFEAIYRTTTTNATKRFLNSDTTDTQNVHATYLVPTNSTVILEVRGMGQRNNGEWKAFYGNIAAERFGSAIEIFGTIDELGGASGLPWTMVPEADNTNGRVRLAVTGASGATIRWMASVRATELKA